MFASNSTVQPVAQELTPTGISGLDQILNGGLPRGYVYLIRGGSGAGKTTLSLQFLMEGARHGEPTLYIGTSETDGEIRGIAGSHGWSLDGIHLHHHETPSAGTVQTMLHPAELELPQTVESLMALVDQIKPRRLVIDSLAEIRALAQDELWYRRELMALKKRFTDSDCTVLVLEIPHDEQPVLDSVVSGVIELEQVPQLYGPDRRRIRALKVRGQEYVSGYHDYKIRRGGLDVFPRLTAADFRSEQSGGICSTGHAAIDAMLCGGITCGTSLLLLGPSGTGKSVMATQLAVAAAERGERSAFYVFDERIQTLLQRAHGIGLNLQQHVDSGLIQIRQVDPTELTSGEFSHIVKQRVETDGIRHLIIDSLNGYSYAMPEVNLLSVFLHELSSYLNQQGVISIFTMTQHGFAGDHLSQPFDVSYIADAVMLFRHFEMHGDVRKAISIYKNRSGNHEATIREYRISSQGITIGEPLRDYQGVLSGMAQYRKGLSHADSTGGDQTGI